MRKLGLSALVLAPSHDTFGSRTKKLPQKTPGQPSQSAWVEQTLKKMTLREKLGQMLMVYYFGVFTSTESAEYKELLHQVEENHVGGMIVGTSRGPLGIERSQVYPTAVITNELQRRAKIPLLIGADFESGTGMRLDEGTSFPSAMAVAATGDPEARLHRRQNHRARSARRRRPLDLRARRGREQQSRQSHHQRSLVWRRSAKASPNTSPNSCAAWKKTARSPPPKHFPGHGNVSVDSHLALAIVPGDREELDGTELVPFRAAIAAGVSFDHARAISPCRARA